MDAKTLIWIAGWTLSLLLSYTIVRERRSPNSTTAWLVFVFAFPFVGALIYLLIGTRKRVGRSRRPYRKKGVPAPAGFAPQGQRQPHRLRPKWRGPRFLRFPLLLRLLQSRGSPG